MAQYKRKDQYYQKAKSEGFRSRAAYKLQEIQDRFNLLKRGYKVLDLGAWPGSWLQYAAQCVGESGIVVGVDLAKIEDFHRSNIKVIQGDAADQNLLAMARELAGEGAFDLLLSDMSPKLSGVKEVDRMAVLNCAELAMRAASSALKVGGAAVIKVFKSPEIDAFFKKNRRAFDQVVRLELDATRSSSDEFYLICFGFRPGQNI